MEDLLKQLEVDWGASGKQWTGQEVQDYIKKWFKAISDKFNEIGTGGNTSSPGDSDVSLNDINEALKKLQQKVTNFLGEGDAPEKGQSIESIAEELKKLQDTNVGDFVKSLNDVNNVESVANIPVNKRLVIATISDDESFSLQSTPGKGEEIHVIVKNSAEEAKTITLPNDGGYVCLVDSALSIDEESYAEINVLSDGSNMYIRAI